MKLSKLILSAGLRNATITIHNSYTVGELFLIGRSKPLLKVWQNFDLDVDVKECDLSLVKHLGYKRYRDYKNNKLYVNIYNY